MLIRFELCDRQQIAQVIEPVALREPDQVCQNVGDETRRLIRAAIVRQLARERSSPPGR